MAKRDPRAPQPTSDSDIAENAMIQEIIKVSKITEEIAITNFTSAHDSKIVGEGGIRAILCLDKTLAGDRSLTNRGINALSVVNLKDGDNPLEDFTEAIDTLEALRLEYGKVLVHCRAGKSRSVAVVSGWLVKYGGLSPNEALAEVEAKRPSALDAKLRALVYRLQ